MKNLHNVFVPDYTDQDNEHWYIHTETGARLPSVTTISSILHKSWILDWKMREGIKSIIKTGVSDYEHAFEKAKNASQEKSQDALTIGSAVHDTIETYLKNWQKYNKKPSKDVLYYYLPDFKLDNTTHLRYDDIQLQVIAGLRSAQSAINKYKTFKPVVVEICVGDTVNKYAGKLDLLCDIDGKLEIWDWKTSVIIPADKPDYPIQINAYRKAFEKMTNKKVHKQRIVQLSKSEDKYTMYEVEKSNDLLKAFYALCKYYDTVIKGTHKYYREIFKHD
jgi:hypothetical protein